MSPRLTWSEPPEANAQPGAKSRPFRLRRRKGEMFIRHHWAADNIASFVEGIKDLLGLFTGEFAQFAQVTPGKTLSHILKVF